MARNYRFFTRNLTSESLEQNPAMDGQPVRPFHLTENLEPEIFFQLTKVLRIKVGDGIALLPSNAGKNEFHYLVKDVQKKELVLNLERVVENKNELAFELGLILCLPNKPDKLEFILQKAVELGTSKIFLTEGEFSQMKHNLRLDRLRKILIEAAEQSERALVPDIVIAGRLVDFLKNSGDINLANLFVAMERLNACQDSHMDLKKMRTGESVQILIGPEGGFSENEKQLITGLGLKTFSLGKRILRMETAAILALGLAALAD